MSIKKVFNAISGKGQEDTPDSEEASSAPGQEQLQNVSDPNAGESVDMSPPASTGNFDSEALHQKVIDMVSTCYDPEIPVNIYELGLIYRIEIQDDASVDVDMTLTAPNCPVAGTLPGEVQEKIKTVEGISDCRLKLVWEPAWDMSKMSEAAKLQLGMDG